MPRPQARVRDVPRPITKPAPGLTAGGNSFIGNGHDKILHTVSGDGGTDAGEGYLCDGSDGLHARRDG